MALSFFEEGTRIPTESDLRSALGATAPLWEALITGVTEGFSPVEQLWNFGGARFGWSLRLRQKKRVLLYLIPQREHFLVGVVLGRRAAAEAEKKDLPPALLQSLREAPVYAEGRGFRFPVTTPADVSAALELVALKLA